MSSTYKPDPSLVAAVSSGTVARSTIVMFDERVLSLNDKLVLAVEPHDIYRIQGRIQEVRELQNALVRK